MTVLISAAVAAAMLNAIPTNASKELEAELHIGDPGPTGIENPAKGTSERKKFVLPLIGEAEAGSGRKNSTAAEWAELAAAETLTFVSFWELFTFRGYGQLALPKPVNPGDSFSLPVGSIAFTL